LTDLVGDTAISQTLILQEGFAIPSPSHEFNLPGHRYCMFYDVFKISKGRHPFFIQRRTWERDFFANQKKRRKKKQQQRRETELQLNFGVPLLTKC
jgi:hypothetical protein